MIYQNFLRSIGGNIIVIIKITDKIEQDKYLHKTITIANAKRSGRKTINRPHRIVAQNYFIPIPNGKSLC